MIENTQSGPLRVDRELKPFTGKTLFSARRHNQNLSKIQPLLRLQWVAGSKFNVHWSDGNVGLEYPSSGIGAGPGGATTMQMQITGHFPDYLACNGYTGGFADSNVYFVAKPIFLRYSIPIGGTEVIDSITVTYVYDTPGGGGTILGQRVASVTSPSAASINEAISRPYNVGDIIYADWVSNGTGVSIGGIETSWIDKNNDARNWRIQYGQI